MRAVSDLSELGPLAIVAVGVLAVLLVLRRYSFPSGHAANTAALVGSLVMILRSRWARVVGAVVGAAALLLVGYSQLELGRHYPSDLLAGWLWAGAWIGLLAWIRSRWRARLPESRREIGRT